MKSSRQKKILDMLMRDGVVKTSELQSSLGVSIETIRRDFNQLEKGGFLVKTYGGAMANKQVYVKPDLATWQVRMKSSIPEKKAIAQHALKHVAAGSLLAMDSGTTTFELAKHLNKCKDITVITNDINTADEILRSGANQIFLLGGMVTGNGSTNGYLAKQVLNNFSQIDMYIFSCDGVTIEDGFTTSSLENNELKRILAEKAVKRIALVDNTKFNKKSLFKISGFEHVDIVITDSLTPQYFVDQIREKGIIVDVVSIENIKDIVQG